MYYAMAFIDDGYGYAQVRAVRINPFKSLEAAIRAVQKVGHGYVKKLNVKQPVWSNVA